MTAPAIDPTTFPPFVAAFRRLRSRMSACHFGLVALLLLALAGCESPTTTLEVEEPQAANFSVSGATVRITSGDQETVSPGETIKNVEIEVLDGDGEPIKQAPVDWVVVEGDGSPNKTQTATNGRGRTSVHWTTGSEPGRHELEARVQDVGSVTFTATVEEEASPENEEESEEAEDPDSGEEDAGDGESDDDSPQFAGGEPGEIWISRDALADRPTSGAAWDNVRKAADTNLSGGVLTDRDDHNVRVMAAALVAARLDDDGYRSRVRDALVELMDARLDDDDGLAVNRRLVAYVAAADLIGLSSFDPRADDDFRAWLERVRTTSFQSGGGGTMAEYHERRPNNYGTMAGASRMATAIYLGDTAELERAAEVFRGWLGDRSAYSGFKFGSDLSWQADERAPAGINPRGATKDGRNVDGVLPDDQRRCGSIEDEPWPCTTNYAYGGLAGAFAQAQILRGQGYDAFGWEDRALLRAMTWLHDVADQSVDGDREWQAHLVNGVYGTSFPAPDDARPGKNVGWTDWTH